ncbi:MAG: DUF5689 domain-containing protein [Bacteroidales bacterium]|jgi:hypothetical protein|nr:DUF5689 domain-containing protein [Bacteroidales bacterium]
MKNIVKQCLFFPAIALLLSACDKDVAPIRTFDGKATCTIAEFLEYHEVGSLDSYDSLPQGTVICGIVISEDKEGNCYKILNIQDSTGGIQIKVANTALYHRYPIGQRIYVKCDGLVLGDYRKLPQLGWWDPSLNNGSGGMAAVPLNRESLYLFADGAPEPEPAAKVIAKATDIIPEYYNCLVKLENATFDLGGQATFSDVTASTDRTVSLAGGGSVVVRSSNYSNFASNILPKGTGTIYGIMTRYNNTNQLVIRNLNDLQGFVSTEDIYTLDVTQDPFTSGWINKNISGNSWTYLNNSSAKGFLITGDGSTVSYLISPAINLTGVSDAVLNISHRIAGGTGSSAGMKLFYTNSASADINEADLHELNIPSYPSSISPATITLPAGVLTSNCRLVFKYMDNQNTTWYIGAFRISGMITNK